VVRSLPMSKGLTILGIAAFIPLVAALAVAFAVPAWKPAAFFPGVLGLHLLLIWWSVSAKRVLHSHAPAAQASSAQSQPQVPVLPVVSSVLMFMVLLNHLALHRAASMQVCWGLLALSWLGYTLELAWEERGLWREHSARPALLLVAVVLPMAGLAAGYLLAEHNPFLDWNRAELHIERTTAVNPAWMGESCSVKVASMPATPWGGDPTCHLRVRCGGENLVPGIWQGAFSCTLNHRDGRIAAVHGGDDDYEDGDPAWAFDGRRFWLETASYRIWGELDFED
jgi:hypothetical protein